MLFFLLRLLVLMFLGKRNSKFHKVNLILFKMSYCDVLYTALNMLSRLSKNTLLMELAITFTFLKGKKYLLFALLILIHLNVNRIVSICFF